MTLNFQALISKNSNISVEFSRTGKMISPKRGEMPLYLLKKDPANAAREKRVLKYEGRKNSCTSCNLALPATKVCDNCD